MQCTTGTTEDTLQRTPASGHLNQQRQLLRHRVAAAHASSHTAGTHHTTQMPCSKHLTSVTLREKCRRRSGSSSIGSSSAACCPAPLPLEAGMASAKSQVTGQQVTADSVALGGSGGASGHKYAVAQGHTAGSPPALLRIYTHLHSPSMRKTRSGDLPAGWAGGADPPPAPGGVQAPPGAVKGVSKA